MPTIHLINRMENSSGGSEWRTYELYRLLSNHCRVRVWCTGTPDPKWKRLMPIRRIRFFRRPWRGTWVFVGFYFKYPGILPGIRPGRIIIVVNTPCTRGLSCRLRELSGFPEERVEYVFASRWLMESTDHDGHVEPSPIDLGRFHPQGREYGKRFRTGRLSRDISYKHHPEDPVMYADLLKQGIPIRIMGGTCLRGTGLEEAGAEILSEGAEDAAAFLDSIDCFVFRTDPEWKEPHGRVIQEAMAAGLPVVCHREGGCAEYIRHGINGFLFEETGEAKRLIHDLKTDPALRERIGREARQSMERLFSPARLDSMVRFYAGRKEPCSAGRD